MTVEIKTAPGISDADRALLERLGATGDVSDMELIYSGRNQVYRTADGRLCVKAYKVPGLAKRAMYGFLRKSKAFRAFDNALMLRELGIPTPAAVGAVECKNSGMLGRTYYVCEFTPGRKELRGVEKETYFPSLCRALAEFIYRLHRNGVLMKDLTPGNVLYRRQGSYFDFMLVDINRMEFDVEDAGRLLANFGSPLDTEAGVHALAREYATVCGRSELEGEIMDIYRNHQKMLLRKKALKKIIKRNR